MALKSPLNWTPARPNALVIACSDGRLQEATDDFLAREFTITQYDRFYVPGGGGALVSSGADPIRADRMLSECHYLIDLHAVKNIFVLFHGPAEGGRIEAACADYRRKLPWATVADLRARQIADAEELVTRRREWANDADLHIYRCEVNPTGSVHFVDLAPGLAFKHPPLRRSGGHPAQRPHTF